MINVLLADDETLVRQGVRMILDSDPGISVVAEVADGSLVVDAAAEYKPDVAIIDVRMPELDGLTALKGLLGLPSRPRVIMLTAFALNDYLYAALDAGADGFLIKDVSPQELVHAVYVVMGGDAMLSPSMTRRLIQRYASSGSPRHESERRRLEALPPEQRQILVLLTKGLPNAEIGARVGLTESQVKVQVSRLLHVLKVNNRVQAAILAQTAGILDPS